MGPENHGCHPESEIEGDPNVRERSECRAKFENVENPNPGVAGWARGPRGPRGPVWHPLGGGRGNFQEFPKVVFLLITFMGFLFL